MTADVHFNCFTTCLFFQKETKIKFLEGNQNRNFRWKLKQKFKKEIKYFKRNQDRIWKETKMKILEGN